MGATEPTEPVCGARHPERRHHPLPCIRDAGHEDGTHVNAIGEHWPVWQPVRMCVRCERITDEPVLVQEVHGNSGPGWNVYACPTCAPHIPKAADR